MYVLKLLFIIVVLALLGQSLGANAQEIRPASTASVRAQQLDRLVRALDQEDELLRRGGLTTEQGLAISQYVWKQVNSAASDIDVRQDMADKDVARLHEKIRSLEARVRKIESRPSAKASRQDKVCK